MNLLLTIVTTTVTVALCTSLHYESIRLLDRLLAGRARRRRWLPLVLAGLVLAHLIEIACYAMAFAIGAGPLGLGGFGDGIEMRSMDVFYFAAETYSSLGYGDLVPTGELRLIASVEPLNGLLLLAWSGSYLFDVVTRTRSATERIDPGASSG